MRAACTEPTAATVKPAALGQPPPPLLPGQARAEPAAPGRLPPLPERAAQRLERLQAALPLSHGAWDEPWEVRKAEYGSLFWPRDCSPAYGELDREGIGRLLCAASLGPEDSFVDVGSGLGKLVIVAAVLTSVRTAWGVELSPSRHQKAVRGVDRLCEAGAMDSAECGRVRLVQGDCADSLPEELLGASHFLLTMKRSHKSMRHLRDALRDRPLATHRPRVIWSVAHNLPHCRGLRYRQRFEVEGFYRPPQRGPRSVGAGGHTKNFVVHEYTLEAT